MQRSKVTKDRKVKYDGFNRSYLKNYPVAKLTGEYAASNSSAQVAFYNEKGEKVDLAWVGLDYIHEVNYIHQDTIDALTKKRDNLKAQIDGLDVAITALQDLG